MPTDEARTPLSSPSEDFAVSGIGSIQLDGNGTIIAIDAEARRLLGLEDGVHDAPLDHQVAFLISFPALVRQTLETGQLTATECPYRMDGGGIRWVLASFTADCKEQNKAAIHCIIRDITQYKETERELRRRAELERLIIASTLRLMRATPEGIHRKTIESLQVIGECIDADRGYVVLFHRDRRGVSECHEWNGRGVELSLNTRRDHFSCDLSWLRGMLREHDALPIPDVNEMPTEARREQAILRSLGVRSTLLLPLYDKGELVGIAGFEAVSTALGWSEPVIDALREFSEVFENTLVQLPAFMALRESEERYRTLVENSHDAIFILSPTGRIQNANPACTALSGYPRSTLIGMRASALFHDADDFRSLQKILLTRQEFRNQEVLLRHADGSALIALLSVSLRFSAQGGIVAAQGLVRDITREKQAEAELVYRVRFERLMVAISTRFINLNPDEIDEAITDALKELGEFAQVDRCSLLVFQEERQAQRPDESGDDVGPDALEVEKDYEWCAPGVPARRGTFTTYAPDHFPWAMKQLLQDETIYVPSAAALPPEAQAERAFMEERGYQSLVIVPISFQSQLLGLLEFDSARSEREWSGELIGLLRVAGQAFGNAIERQRTEKKRAELEAQVRHAQKLESLGILAGGIAHDFNNLLVGILGNAGLALLELPEKHTARDGLTQIEQAALRLADLTNQMLAYSGKGHFLIEPVDLSELATEMHQLLRTVVSKRAILEMDLASNMPLVMADPTQLRQIIMNLITNASDAIESSSGVITIRTGVEEASSGDLANMFQVNAIPSGNYAYIEVSDTGTGMDEETRNRIFDPFFTTKFTGRGLGLAAVLGIVGGHKGAIQVDSTPGEGTTFRVLFPVTEKKRRGDATEHKDDVSQWHCNATILVADDEDNVRRVTTAVLERFGFTVIMAEDGCVAVDTFRERADSIDVVLLDMTMPHMDGAEAFRRIRSIQPNVPVILTSGYTEQESVDRLGEGGLAGFIQKPYSALALIQQLRAILEGDVQDE